MELGVVNGWTADLDRSQLFAGMSAMAWRICPLITVVALGCLMAVPTQAEPEKTVAALRVAPGGRASIEFRVTEAPDARQWLNIECKERCTQPIHSREKISDAPLGFLNIDGSDLVYSLWSTGCCYVVRVWRVTPSTIEMVFEQGSRGVPSVRTSPDIAIETYMRPTDERGRELSTDLETITWAYEAGKFTRSPKSRVRSR